MLYSLVGGVLNHTTHYGDGRGYDEARRQHGRRWGTGSVRSHAGDSYLSRNVLHICSVFAPCSIDTRERDTEPIEKLTWCPTSMAASRARTIAVDVATLLPFVGWATVCIVAIPACETHVLTTTQRAYIKVVVNEGRAGSQGAVALPRPRPPHGRDTTGARPVHPLPDAALPAGTWGVTRPFLRATLPDPLSDPPSPPPCARATPPQ